MNSKTPTKNNYSQISEQKVKIIIRMRPILQSENSHQFVYLQDDNTLEIRRPGNFIRMKFNNILPPDSTQKDVFCLLEDSIKQFLKGTNVTIFSYGQTGTGKTYSIMGKFSPNQQYQNMFDFLSSRQRGVLSRSLQMVMKLISQKKSSKISVSFFQIYNQKIYDLYNFTLKPLQIRQGKSGEVYLPNLTKVQVSNINQVITFLIAGFKNRATGETIKNARSSRSHCIFQINLLSENQNRQTIHSTLRIVDLAGSQKFKIPMDLSSQQKQVHTQELISINSSLSSLGFCISALTQKSRSHIPFRNSKLTRVLSDSLLGNGLMRFIICISPSLSASNETFSTLQFANRAKKAVYNRNELSHEKSISKLQSEQITKLKQQLSREREMRENLQHELESIIDQFPQYLSRMQSKEDLSKSHKNKSKYEDQASRETSYEKYNYHKFFKQKNKDQSIKYDNKTPKKETSKSNQRINSQCSVNFNRDFENMSKSPNKSIKYIAFSQAASPNTSQCIKNNKNEEKYNIYDTATILSSKNKSLNTRKKQAAYECKQNSQRRQKIRSFFIQSPDSRQNNIKYQYKAQKQQNFALKQLKHQLNKRLKQKYSNINQSPTFKKNELQQLMLPSESRTQQDLVQVCSKESDPNIMPYKKQSLIFLREIDKSRNSISYSRSFSNSSIDQLNQIFKQNGHNVSRRDRIINLFR